MPDSENTNPSVAGAVRKSNAHTAEPARRSRLPRKPQPNFKNGDRVHQFGHGVEVYTVDHRFWDACDGWHYHLAGDRATMFALEADLYVTPKAVDKPTGVTYSASLTQANPQSGLQDALASDTSRAPVTGAASISGEAMATQSEKMKEAARYLKSARSALLTVFVMAKTDINNVEAEAESLEKILVWARKLEALRGEFDVEASIRTGR